MLIEIYNQLYNKFGKQGWWPLTKKGFYSKHYSGKPKNDKERFEIIVGAILTQNTSWNNVEKALYNLSKNNLLDVKKINKINQKKLAALTKPAGYYNQKAERLKIIAGYIAEHYNGKVFDFLNKQKTIKELREELLSIKGVGPETADSMILYAAEKPSFVIDAYTKRVFSRLGLCKENVDYGDLKALFEKELKKDTALFQEYHALIVKFGKEFCKKKPQCKDCFLQELCVYKNK